MFSNWLIQHTTDESWAGVLKFPHERGMIRLQGARIESVDPHTKVMGLSIRGHNHIPLPDGSILAAPDWDGSEYITFKLVPLSEQRTVVTAACGVPLIQPYFRMLLTTISERYPASAAPIDEALQLPTATLAEVLLSLAAQALPASWHIVLDCSLTQFETAVEKHLLPLRTAHPIPDYAVDISRDYESENGVYVRYNVKAGIEEPTPGAPNVLSHKHREIGRISGAYHNALQTRMTIGSEGLNDALFGRIVANFLGAWRDATQPQMSPTEKNESRAAPQLDVSSVRSDESLEPWEQIEDYKWDRKAVQLLWEGYEDSDIAKQVGRDAKTVTNRLSVLRGQYPKQVPTRSELKALRLQERKLGE
jgi:hypothetical protein